MIVSTACSASNTAKTVARAFLLCVCLLFGATRAHAQPPASRSSTETELRRIEDAWAQAAVHRDAKALRSFVMPTWVYSDESGLMEHDAGIAAFTIGTDTVRQASNASMRVQVYGSTAVVTGILQMKGRGPKGAFTHRYRYTDTWIKRGGVWKCVASQDYLMPAGQ